MVGDLSSPESLAEHFDQANVIIDSHYPDYTDPVNYTNRVLDATKESANRRADKNHAHLVFIFTTGTWQYGDTRKKTVSQGPLQLNYHTTWRVMSEKRVLPLAPNVRSISIRPSLVCGRSCGYFDVIFSGVVEGTIKVSGDLQNCLILIHTDFGAVLNQNIDTCITHHLTGRAPCKPLFIQGIAKYFLAWRAHKKLA